MTQRVAPAADIHSAGSRSLTAPKASPVATTSDFEQIYRTHVRFVWRGLRACGVADAAVQDVAQEVFLIVHRRLPEYDPATNIRTWIYSIARRVAANHRRGARRLTQREEKAGEGRTEIVDPRHTLAARRDLRRLQTFVDTLDADARELFFLSFLEELNAREIGELLGINPHTVNTRVRALRNKLRGYWAPDETSTDHEVISRGR